MRDFEPRYGEAVQVSPRIRRVVADNPGPFTFAGTGTYLIGAGQVAVIDPGPDDPAHLAALRAALAGEKVSHILVTHTHRDHSPLTAALARETGAQVLGTPAPRHGAEGDEGQDLAFAPDVTLKGGEVVSGPDWTLEVIPTPGHASNHMAFALLEENALFCGDHVMGWSTTIVSPPDGDMGDYLASLRTVMARGFDTLWPTHGGPVTEAAPFLEAYLTHRLEREAQILAVLAHGPATIMEMVPRLYAAVDPSLWPAARRSVLAHLIKLTREGGVKADPAPTETATYALA